MLTSKTLAEGQRQIVDVNLPGGILDPASADPTTSAVEIEALTDTCIAVIPRRDWQRACTEHRELWELNQQVNRAALARISERMLRLGKAPAETMIAFVLCELCLRSSARGVVNGWRFHIPMTQQQLGDLCGLSAVHICRTLRRVKRNGVLSVTDHMDILVKDVDAMARIAEIDIASLRNEIV
jgi:CRP-like cAMP-binding protein